MVPVVSNATNIHNPLDGGWIEEINGVTVLHVSGSHYDMGYQHGNLLKDKIEQNYRALFSRDDTGETYDYILDMWNTFLKHTTPECYIEEMHGLANGSGKSFEDVVVFVIGHDAFLTSSGCMEMAAWGDATADGKLHHLYSLDLNLDVKDPVTNTYLQENQIITIRKLDGGYASLESFYAGTFAGTGGINENQLAISLDSSWTTEFNWNHTSLWFRILKVLDYAYVLDEAVNIMTSSLGGCVNYIISDGKIPMSYVCEETANYSYVGAWEDKNESKTPFWSIENVVRRKNMYIHPTTSKTQRRFYDPRIYLFHYFVKQEEMNINWFNTWSFYKTLSKETEKKWGNLNLSNILEMARSIYNGETNLYLKISKWFGFETFSSFHQWVACPETGDVLISFADGENQAQYNKIHEFNLYDLLESQPP